MSDENNINARERAIQIDQEQLVFDIFGSKENATKTAKLIETMLSNYNEKPMEVSLTEWLKSQYSKYTTSDEKNPKEVEDVVNTITEIDKSAEELEENKSRNIPESQWIKSKIEEGASAANISNIASYANMIDNTLKESSELSFKTFTNIDGSINLNKNLHGFVAEAHHVNTFNIEAASNNSNYHARMLESTNKNSVDIIIEDMLSGKTVRRYQSKYGYDSKATSSYLQEGDYRGQRKLVPDGQEQNIAGSCNVIESPDGVRSKPLTYADSQAIKEQIQIRKEISEYKWDGIEKISLSKSVVAETGKIALFHALFQGGRIAARRIIKSIKGEKQNPIKDDLKEWFDSSWIGGRNIIIQSIVSTAVLIAARNGWIKLLQHTPAGKIASIVYIGLQNAKVLYRVAKGDLSIAEGLEHMQRATLSAVGGLIGMGKGVMIGSTIGGPVGAVVGGIVGSIAGSATADLINAGFNKVKKTVYSRIKNSYKNIAASARKVFSRTLSPFAVFA